MEHILCSLQCEKHFVVVLCIVMKQLVRGRYVVNSIPTTTCKRSEISLKIDDSLVYYVIAYVLVYSNN